MPKGRVDMSKINIKQFEKTYMGRRVKVTKRLWRNETTRMDESLEGDYRLYWSASPIKKPLRGCTLGIQD